MITASLQNYRITPRKVRLVADMIRGKKVSDARTILAYVVKKAGDPLATLLESAVANASHNYKIASEGLYVKELRVDQGYVLKRSLPMARGSAFPLKKRTSHVSLTLAPLPEGKKARAKKVAARKAAAPAKK